MGKARVSPVRHVTIPRLELTAALVSARVATMLKRELKFQECMEEFFWTDSKVVLGYIANDSRRFHVYVANRVQQIRNHSEPSQWKYVRTDENPADEVSRGTTASKLTSTSKWLEGPDFLWKEDLTERMKLTTEQTLSDNDPEVRKTTPLATNVEEFPHHFELERLKHLSDWNQARRAIANCIRFKELLKNRARKEVQEQADQPKDTDTQKCQPTVEDLQQAEREIIKVLQAKFFAKELKVLNSLRVNEVTPSRENAKKRNDAIKHTSQLYRLDPFVDKAGIMRVGGRLRRSGCTPEIKHPVILPNRHRITDLLIRHHHEVAGHQGRGITTNELRTSGYWVIGCSSAVSRIITKCVKCRRLRSRVEEQKMADLPVDRLEPAPPFTYCAVDLFGPWYIKQGRSELKRYGVLFTCLASRAVHIETANALTTDSFINALRRFIAVRGPIRQLRSDRGTNFIGAQAELKQALSQMDHAAVNTFQLKQNCDYIEFKFNVPSASHMGGVWERQIRTVRNVLAALMSQVGAQFEDESLRTFMCEAAAIVHSRPLTVDNLNDPTSLAPLTPNNLLTMKSHVVLPPPGVFQTTDVYSKKRWRRVQHIANEFWSRWRKEYLQNLQSRPKWNLPRRNIQIGDNVIIKDEDLPRNQWRLARVVEACADQDGCVRKVKLVVGDKGLNAKAKASS